MLNLPADVMAFLAPFAPLFTPSVWYHAQILVVGTRFPAKIEEHGSTQV